MCDLFVVCPQQNCTSCTDAQKSLLEAKLEEALDFYSSGPLTKAV